MISAAKGQGIEWGSEGWVQLGFQVPQGKVRKMTKKPQKLISR